MRIQHLLICLLLTLPFISFAGEDPCHYDNTPPWMACDYHTVVTLGSNGVGTAYAETFDDGSSDNCGIASFEVRRMNQGWCGPGIDDDTYFGPFVQFCCEDLNSGPIWVVLKATDTNGNSNTCMVEVTVQDYGGNIHFQCPPDIVVSCDYWFSEADLWNPNSYHFGTIVPYGEYQNPIWINDPGNPNTNQPHLWGYDGHVGGGGGCYGNNWGMPWITIQEVIDLRNSCGVGKIKRKFFVEYGNWTDWCYQTITVKDFSYSNYGVTWPKDYFVDDCTDDLGQYSPELLPPPYNKPNVGGTYGSCSMIGYAYEDLVFTFAPGACYKILREWTVIDWCKYNPAYPYSGGIYKHTQVIKITNNQPPSFEGDCNDVVVEGVEANCSGKFWKSYDVWDDCTPVDKLTFDYKIDLYSNGSFDIKKSGIGQPEVDRTLPNGWHKILVTVQDQCGNYVTCSHKIQVVDRKKPTPVCLHGISTVVMPIGGEVTIWAKEFNVSSEDNCTPPHKLVYSFAPNGQDMSRIFTCDDIGTVPLQIYVTDEFNNTQYCSTFIRIDDNEGTCDDMNRVEGIVTTFDGIPVPEAEVDLYKIMPDESLKSDRNTKMTDEVGSYETGFGTTSYDRQLMVTKEGNPMDGISTLDLIALQKHILGIELLSSPEQYLAADVDGSGHVGVMDLLTLRNILLGAPIETANLGWYFFDQSCTWDNPADILEMDCSNGFEVNHNSTFPMSVHFNAVKMGDVNFDLTNTAWHLETRSANKFKLEFEPSQSGDILVKASKDIKTFGMQLSLDLPEAIGIEGGVISDDANTMRFDEASGQLFISWALRDAMTIEKGDVLFTIQIQQSVEQISELAGMLAAELQPEIYDEHLNAIDLNIELANVNAVVTPNEQIDAYSLNVAPNPFSANTVFNLTSPVKGNGQIEIYNEVGVLMYQSDIEVNIGTNQIPLTSKELFGGGLYYYQIHIADKEKPITGKLIKS